MSGMEATPQVRHGQTGLRMPRERAWLPIGLGLIGVGAVGYYLAAGLIYGWILPGTAVRAAIALAYLGAGTVAWLRRPEYLTGRLMVLAAFLVLLVPLRRFDNGAIFAIGRPSATSTRRCLATCC
jgi:hypothetical protein